MRIPTLALTALATTTLFAQELTGIPGHIKVELKTAKGWLELYQPAYALQQAEHRLSVPAVMARDGKLTLRLSAPDNDETQIDYLNLNGGRLLSAKDLGNGESYLKKFASADHDVMEVRGRQILAVLQAPKGAEDLELQLVGRSSNNASIPREPFKLGAAAVAGSDRNQMGTLRLSPKDGASVRIDTGAVSSGSGHPSAPILGSVRVAKDRLKAHLDFGPDNDPGDDDYASLVAYDANGQTKEFKVTAGETAHGKAAWAYGAAAPWQHMAFDIDVPLASVPRDKDGQLSLMLLAYGTCSASGANADYYATSVAATGVSAGNPATINVYASTLSGGGGFTDGPVTVTVKVFDPFNVTVSTQVLYSIQNNGSCLFNPALSFSFTPNCSGNFGLSATVVGGNDPNPNNAPATGTLVVTGGSACVYNSPTSTPSPTSTATATPSPSPTSTATRTPVATGTPSWTITPTHTITDTPTPCSGPCPPTPVPTETFAPQQSVTGPVVLVTSAKVGEPIYIVFPSLPSASTVTIYNTAGDRVGEIKQAGANPLWKTSGYSAGLYWLKITATLSDGSNVDTWKKAVIAP